jgi:hypothetical protein
MMEVLPQKKSQASAAINDASDFSCRTLALVSRRNDSRIFHDRDDGALRSTSPMLETPRHHEALPPPQSDGTIRQVDQELVSQDEKELVILVVLMPMVFSLHHAQAHD